VEFVTSVTETRIRLVLLVGGFLLVVGTVLSPVTAVIIFMPIIQSIATLGDTDQIHMGLIVVLTLTLELVTPPYGICLLIATQIGGIPTPQAFIAILPLVGMALTIIVAGIVFPGLFLYLPWTLLPGSL